MESIKVSSTDQAATCSRFSTEWLGNEIKRRKFFISRRQNSTIIDFFSSAACRRSSLRWEIRKRVLKAQINGVEILNSTTFVDVKRVERSERRIYEDIFLPLIRRERFPSFQRLAKTTMPWYDSGARTGMESGRGKEVY